RRANGKGAGPRRRPFDPDDLFAGRSPFAIARAVRGFTALAAGLRGQAAVLREAALFAGHAGAALAGDLALAFRVHRGEAPPGDAGSSRGLTPSNLGFLSWRMVGPRVIPLAYFRFRFPGHTNANESQGLGAPLRRPPASPAAGRRGRCPDPACLARECPAPACREA